MWLCPYGADEKFPQKMKQVGGISEYPKKRVASFSLTRTWSSQISDKSTNIASWLDSSKAANFADDLAHVGKGPPKKFKDPKKDLQWY